MKAALARPSAQETKPSDDSIVQSWRKFVTPLAAAVAAQA
jgi:hypothetical protein